MIHRLRRFAACEQLLHIRHCQRTNSAEYLIVLLVASEKLCLVSAKDYFDSKVTFLNTMESNKPKMTQQRT